MSKLSDAELLRQTILYFSIAQKRELARHGPPGQTRMLAILLRGGVMSQAEFGRRMGLEKSWVSRAVDKLVEQGWVSRRDNPADARSVELSLTEKGLAHAQMLSAEMDQHAKRVLARLDSEERAQVMHAIRLLNRVIDHPDAPSAHRTTRTE